MEVTKGANRTRRLAGSVGIFCGRVGIALDCGAEGHGFEPGRRHSGLQVMENRLEVMNQMTIEAITSNGKQVRSNTETVGSNEKCQSCEAAGGVGRAVVVWAERLVCGHSGLQVMENR